MNSHEETIKELAGLSIIIIILFVQFTMCFEVKINIQNNAVLMLAAPSTTNQIAEIEAMFGIHHV